MHKEQISGYVSNELFSAISLPYSSGTFHMRIVLPNENVPISTVVNALGRPGYLAECMRQTKTCKVDLSLPKYEIKADFRLDDILQTLGVNKAFYTSDGFSALTDAPFSVSKVKQAVCLKVDEEGSEGAAATAIVSDSAPLFDKATFNADRPFLFMITENETGAILFIGTVETL